MHNRPLSAAFVVLFAVTSILYAQPKIGYINSDEILEKYQGAKAAEEKLAKELTGVQLEVTKRENEIKGLNEQIEKQSYIMSAERKKELADSLQQKYMQYQQFVKEKQQEGISRRAELFKPISDTVTKIIDRIAKEENYDIVLDAHASGIVYALPKYNLTARTIDLLSMNTKKTNTGSSKTLK